MSDSLATRHLSVTLDAQRALSDVTIAFPRGQISAIVGPSGAGKTTLLRCLNGLQAPSTGSVFLDGMEIETIAPTQLRRRVGLVFQQPLLFEGTVRDNLMFGLDDGVEVDVDGVLARAALGPEIADRPSGALSLGESQRVAIARALTRDPEILLMDEPTSALDRDSRRAIESLVCGLSTEGLTVVVVTHDLAQAERVADRAWMIVDGEVKAEGDPESLEQMWTDTR